MFHKEDYKGQKSIVIYFSRYIHEITNADLFKVEPKIPYAKDYNTCIEEARVRQATHNAEIEERIPDLTDYEVIYIGSPVYWGDMPEELVTALKDIDFSGKTIRPFTTHEGSDLGNIPNQIKSICNGVVVLEGLSIRGTTVNVSKQSVENWI